jgi:RNase P subunit RPR2
MNKYPQKIKRIECPICYKPLKPNEFGVEMHIIQKHVNKKFTPYKKDGK